MSTITWHRTGEGSFLADIPCVTAYLGGTRSLRRLAVLERRGVVGKRKR